MAASGTRAIDVPAELKKKTPTPSQGYATDNLSFTPTTSNLRRAQTHASNPFNEAPSFTNNLHPLHLILEQEPLFPEPLSPDKCPLFCCFYAEFDIRVGPKVCFQSPRGFMNRDMSLQTETIHEILANTFELARSQETQEYKADGFISELEDDILGKSGSDHSSNSKQNGGAGNSTLEVGLSIFDSTSEYIITGNELAGKIINLSTHYVHILTRPTVISNERYERNSLLFSVGFVLRRAEDPRTFRPLLSKWALTLQSMEIESKFLSDTSLRLQIQPMLDRILVSLNSSKSECHLLMNQANLLSLKRFRPPVPPSSPVPDHAVPILLRRDWELHLYDWDLAINWVVMHIDGVANARQISKRSEVDMEMVRACLRVLKHHGVIALVDMFFYTNRYEFTERATAMLAGKEPDLLQQAVDYVVKIPVDTSRHSEPALLDSVRLGEGIPGPMFSSRSPISSFPPAADRLSKMGLRVTVRNAEARRGDEILRTAIAELHCACTRNMSFADLWSSLVSDSLSPLAGAKYERFGKTRLGQSSSQKVDHNETTPFSPAEAGYMDSGQQLRRNNIDWNAIFQMFDHRRWATFAVVHGLLRRVHNYPLALVMNEHNKKDSSKENKGRFESRTLRSDSEDLTHRANKIVAMMDGTHSDDELVTEFNRPLDKLIQIVESSGAQFIFSVYSTVPKGG